ncbi:MAG: hypothetical protein ABIG71_02480, partial [Candidatus Uhrbacteria bacterium]
VCSTFGIDGRVCIADLDWEALLPSMGQTHPKTAPAAQQSAKRDLAFLVDERTTYADIAAVLDGVVPELIRYTFFDAYVGSEIPKGKKSLAFHFEFCADDRTLTAVEVETLLGRVVEALKQQYNVVVRA